MQLILASASIGREYLLRGLKIPYRVLPSGIDEDKIREKNLEETIMLRAKLKGEHVVKKIIQSTNQQINQLSNDNKTVLILSADTEVIINKQLLGKPKDYDDAVRMLKTLSGKTHEVVSAFYIIKQSLILVTGDAKEGSQSGLHLASVKKEYGAGRVNYAMQLKTATGKPERQDPQIKVWSGYDRSFVTFRKLTDPDIKLYLSVTEYTRYTGSYALIASPQNFITKIEGSISNVIGLPLEKVIPIFRNLHLL